MPPSPAPSSPLSSAPPSPPAQTQPRVFSGAKWATSPPAVSNGPASGNGKGQATTNPGIGAEEIEEEVDELDPSDEEKEVIRLELDAQNTPKKRKRGRQAKGENEGIKKARASRTPKSQTASKVNPTSVKSEDASAPNPAAGPSEEGEEELEPWETAQDSPVKHNSSSEVGKDAIPPSMPLPKPKKRRKSVVERSVQGTWAVPTELVSTRPPQREKASASTLHQAQPSRNATASSSAPAPVPEMKPPLAKPKPKYVRPSKPPPIDVPPGVRPPPKKHLGRPSNKYLEEYGVWMEEIEKARANLRGEEVEGGPSRSSEREREGKEDVSGGQTNRDSLEDPIPKSVPEPRTTETVSNGSEGGHEPKKESCTVKEGEEVQDGEEKLEVPNDDQASLQVELAEPRRFPQAASRLPSPAPVAPSADISASPRNYAPPLPPDLPPDLPPPPKKLNPGRPTNKYLEEYAAWWDLVEKEKKRLGESSGEEVERPEASKSVPETPKFEPEAVTRGETSARGRGRGRGRGKVAHNSPRSRPSESSQSDTFFDAAATITTTPSASAFRPSESVIGIPPSRGPSEPWTPSRGRLKVRGRARGVVRAGRVLEAGEAASKNEPFSSPLQTTNGSLLGAGSPEVGCQIELLESGDLNLSHLHLKPNGNSSQLQPVSRQDPPEPQEHIILHSPTPNPPKQIDLVIPPFRPNPPLPKTGHLASFLVLNPPYFLTPADGRVLPLPPVPAGGFSFREKEGKSIQRFLGPRKMVLDITTPGSEILGIPNAEKYYKSASVYQDQGKGKARQGGDKRRHDRGHDETEADEVERLDEKGRKVQMLYRVLVVNKDEEEAALESDDESEKELAYVL
ncbi:hypothetical protein IAR50_005027 [Cryptococcus sp. DSM 104548]